ncbi:dipeptide ABC transporter, periplasmic dipeptide-binding protein [Caenispirillum salinarum AK4]|uniref:Dipeptide ABC transporter, periplasmic dipeptide-binding protein n=1 Tax=Caenispirillum salinarum AK4 TaxID=1238182 RepID=K9H0Q2_9PROT|nr:ABC transporter substrate-binding protein [Caenispirillum salinarum]EKV31855.1 dipeptide ABC transporter, periplasmic dipeptide-binding protein [Caenispirillum salinarum AK4]
MTARTRFTLDRRRFLQSAAAGTAGIVASGLPLSQAIWAQEGKVLRVRSYADINKLDPGFYQNAYNVSVMNCIYSGLMNYKPGTDWATELQAAESIEQIDPTHIRFKLKPGLMFTGGYGEITAEDVKFSFERVILQDSPMKDDWGPLNRVEVEDTHTGVIVLDRPFVPLWNVSLPYGVGHIVSKEAVLEATGDGGDFGMQPPMFSGPYVIADWRPNEVLILERNPDWTGQKPGFDEIQIRPIEDPQTAETAYRAGDIDFTHVSLSSLEQLNQRAPENTVIEERPSLYYVYLGMNMEHPKLQDINVRKAIQWAVNIPQLLEVAYFGYADVATGMIAPGLVGHRDKALIPPEGDLEKAREFLAEAGAEGLQLRIDVLNQAKFTTMAQVIQAQLGQIGIDLQIDVQDAGSFWTIGMETEGERWKDMQLILQRFSMVPDPFYATTFFTCEQVGNWNWERFCSERFDALNREATTVQDEEKRAQMYHEMQDLMEESGAYRFLTHEGAPFIYRRTVLEPATRPDGRALYRYFQPV